MKRKINLKSVISLLLSVAMLMSVAPVTTFAAQSNEYVDPADNWLNSNGRTNELDVNATTTYETQYCCVCDKDTTVLTYRVPEYTRSGTTALNRDVRYSDGTKIDGESQGNTDSGSPGVDAYYTSHHYTKSVCQLCGTINSVNGYGAYDFNNNVYSLHACDSNFFIDFDATTYEQYDEDYHITSLKRGKYCQYCKGTTARATTGLEYHDFTESVDAQLSNNRFYTTEKCSDCGYESSEYVTAKSVVSSYYGTEDGDAHTVTVSDLSESGVRTSIRYGTTAENCNKTSAPNYTEAGYYPIYYKITYTYAGEEMTENGVSYVWLLEENEENGDTIIVVPPSHEHDLRYLETVAPSCENLGYERWQCDGCGELQKMNYTPAVGHEYEDITIREATCKQGGLKLTLCKNCGDFYQTTTAKGEHKYESHKHNATCRSVGYTEHICSVCGDNYITDMTPLISHSYEHVTKEPTCIDGGYTTSTCTMCGSSYVSNHTDPLGHDWDEGHSVTSSTCTSEGVIEHLCINCDEKMIISDSATGHTPGTEATCTEPQICTVCETVLVLPLGHNHTVEIVEPTCTAMGFSVYTCECGDTYTTDFVDKEDHDFAEHIVDPTCTKMGHTEFSCKNCDAEYIGDFIDKLPHDYYTEVKNPTCSEFGHTVYTCSCGDSYIGDYTDKLEHNYNKKVVEPTCEEHGYAIYECPDCGASYIGDYVENKEHSYVEVKTPATCTEMGYSTFTCECGESYIGNYVDKLPHTYESVITEPSCTTLGYTTKTCKDCGDTLKVDYVEPTGHTPSDWIIDIPATITNSGCKHIECTVCGEKLQTSDIAQLVDSDRTDEDGKAEIGAFSIILTDKNGVPVFNSEIIIDVDDMVTIKLPSGRLLDYADQTTITAFYTENQKPASELNIFIEDLNGNNATGKTDANGQLKVPNNQSNTGDDNGTIGNETEDVKNTYVVSITDKYNVTIPNCEIKIGESNNVVIDLPDGLILTKESPVIVTIKDHNGNPQKDVSVIVIADKDYIEKGVTDRYGKLTVPPVNSGYTDKDGKVHINGFNVIVEDETKKIENAYVTYNEDNTISVVLPTETLIDYNNRIRVTVLNKDGVAVKDISVTVKDTSENERSGITYENGVMTVPPLSEDITDSEGKAVVNGNKITVEDENGVIPGAFIKYEDDKLSVELPEGKEITVDNRITVTVTDSEDNPIKDMNVVVKDKAGRTESNLTDKDGKAVVPPTTFDITDKNGYGELNEYSITVVDETKPLENVSLTLNEDGSITVLLPTESKIVHTNRITVTVVNKTEKTPVKDISVTVSEAPKAEDDTQAAEPKTANGKTDEDGKVIVLLIGILVAIAMKWFIIIKGKNAKKFRQGIEYGSARWGNADDVAPYIDENFYNNIILTQTERLSMNSRMANPDYNTNKNVLVIGGSGSGKTRFFVKPNLMQMHSSYVITDPKGTILIECGKMLVKGGYKIKVLNTINFKKSLHYNPFEYIHDEKDIMKLTNTLIQNTKGEGEKNSEDFWVKAERLLYNALIGYIWYEAPEEEKNFTLLLDMINSFEVREDDENFKNAVDRIFDELAERDPDHYAVRQYTKFKLSAGKTAKSILVSCGARLAPFDIKELRELMEYDELELDTLGDTKTALFIITSDTDSTFDFVTAFIVSQLFNILCTKADDVYNGRLPIHVRCLLDEVANITIPNLHRILSVIRSREISAALVIQAKSQLKAIYKENADTIFGNCDSVLFLGGREQSTLKDLAETLGKETIDIYNTSETRSNQNSYGMNYQKLGKSLMSEDEIAVMKGKKCILQLKGCRPFLSDKFDITKHPNYKYLSDFDKKNAFDIQKYQKTRKPKLNPEEKVQVFTVNMENLQLPTERPNP